MDYRLLIPGTTTKQNKEKANYERCLVVSNQILTSCQPHRVTLGQSNSVIMSKCPFPLFSYVYHFSSQIH